MSNCQQISTQLPMWVPYLQALAVPIVAVLVAGFGAYIAAQQMVIARDKFQHDAFYRQYDRRVVVYEATRRFLANVFDGGISEGEIRAYGLNTLDAQFLFDADLYKYVREIHARGALLNEARLHLENSPSDDQRDALKEAISEQMKWMIQQGDEHAGFAVRFEPFLVDRKTKCSQRINGRARDENFR